MQIKQTCIHIDNTNNLFYAVLYVTTKLSILGTGLVKKQEVQELYYTSGLLQRSPDLDLVVTLTVFGFLALGNPTVV